MPIQNKDILIVNSTVISGILILLTIQSVSFISPQEIIYQSSAVSNESEAIAAKLSNAAKALNDDPTNKTKQLEYEKLFVELNNLNDRIIEFDIEYRYSLNNAIHKDSPISMPMIVLFIVMVPFIISVVSESLRSVKNTKNDATRLGIYSMVVGFILLPIVIFSVL